MPGLKLVVEIDDKGSIKNIETLDAKFDKFKRNVSGGAPRIAAGFKRIGSGVKRVTGQFSRFAMVGKMALAAFGAAAVVVGAKFEQAMANVASVASSEGQSVADTMKELTQIARHWGSQTAFSASEAAEGMYSLASAGFKVKQIGAAIGGVLQYAGATATDLGMAAEGTVQAIKMFGLAAADTNRVVNVFAASISNSMLNSERLKESLAQVGSTAASVGMDLEHTTGVLAVLHNAGQMGAIAGTRLKNVLVQLAAPSKKLSKLLGDVTFTGENMGEVMEALNKKGATAGEVYKAFGRIGGGAVLAMMKAGRDEMEGMTESITGTQKAFEMYEQQMDTVQNQFKVLKSGVEENMIAVFMELKVVLREAIAYMISLVAKARPYIVGIVKLFSKWILENKGLAKTVMVIGAGIAILVTGLSLIWPAVSAAIGIFQILTGVLMVVKAAFAAVNLVALGGWAIVIAAVVAAVLLIIHIWKNYREEMKEIFKSVTNAIVDAFNWILKSAVWLGGKIVWPFKVAFEFIAKIAKWVGGKMKDFFSAPIKWIIDKIKWFANKVGKGMDVIVPGWRDAFGALADVVKDKVGDAAGTVADKTKDIVDTVIEGTADVAKTVGTAVGDAAVATFDYAKDKTTEIASDIKDKAEGIVNNMKSAVDQIQSLGAGGPTYTPPEGPPEPTAEDVAEAETEYQNDLLAEQIELLKFRNILNIANQGISKETADLINKTFEAYDAGHRMQVDAIYAMSDAYDTFYESLWDKEMSWKERRQAAWMSWKRSFLKLQAEMLKQWLILQLKALLISEHARRTATQKERFEYAKLGAIRAYTAMASVPIIGPLLGAAAAAAAFAFLMAFHAGGRIGSGGGERVILAQDDEYVIQRSAARSVGYDTLDQINSTGRLPATSSGPVAINFEINANTAKDAESIAETIEDVIVPILEDLNARGRFKVGVA